MRIKVLYLGLSLALSGLMAGYGQGFQPPNEGKAVVYFVSATKKLIPFELFYNQQFIGEVEKMNYMRFECDPGQQLFWASSENKDFLNATMEAGKSYIVMVEMVSGFWRLNPRLCPIWPGHAYFDMASKLIREKAPYNIPQQEIQDRQAKMTEFIANVMVHYETEWKLTNDVKTLTGEMAIPEEDLK
jgi:hypothetical protein